ncbi:hypothetical protein M6B38_392090 [Iris pallida]|uniref:Uncharacterized protein n=1 Tax=Iris pallida TaxID=29817 RepID=A0AAX6FY99_IRIPA|nr:hypothetical protein M6B38_392090 [Iris pallida]
MAILRHQRLGFRSGWLWPSSSSSPPSTSAGPSTGSSPPPSTTSATNRLSSKVFYISRFLLLLLEVSYSTSLLGISNFVLEAQKSVGWIRDESDSGSTGGRSIGGKDTSRRILRRN